MFKMNPGRLAGLCYLLLMVAPLRLIYIPSKLFVRGDATATAANIAAHPTLFRLGIAADLFGAVMLIFLTIAFYRLFRNVSRPLAALVVVLGGVLPSALYFVNVVHDMAALTIIRGPQYLSVFSQQQRDALARFFLDLHYQQIVAAEVLWGLWLLPLGLLVYRADFFPRLVGKVIGVWLIINCFAYLLLSYTGIFRPDLTDMLFSRLQPAMWGELAIMLWLLIKGVDMEKWQAREVAAAGAMIA
jgi:hypothetical protein